MKEANITYNIHRVQKQINGCYLGYDSKWILKPNLILSSLEDDPKWYKKATWTDL